MKALTTEQLRILVAAAEGRLLMSLSGFYKIEGEEPPDRREREKLQGRGLLTRPSQGGLMVPEKGLEALKYAPIADAPPSKPEQLSIQPSSTKGERDG